ncbi:DsbA family protein [Paracoccus sp. PAR01]|uniref:DsbA family protein n=1 Tax=Paracoccus sp. PAR01 TaxID=2769282 RepID=UPI00177C81E2|nr:DsbA family protein [Paracoccus sp. PAR01]MBD9528627.1 DsbA family protein [Paracoccus sp. PAR01]
MHRRLAAIATVLTLILSPALAQDFTESQIAEIKQGVFNDPDAPVMGNPKGDVTLVEFSDYNCGFCRKTAPDVAAFLKSDPNVKLVVHEIPIFGEGSREAAMAALAAQRQGKYPEFHSALMAMKGRAEKASVLRVARQVGLDVDRLERDMADPAITAQIEQSLLLADQIGLAGTPSFVAGDRAVFGALPPEDLAELVAEARAQKK